jgi:putative flippase GtrA
MIMTESLNTLLRKFLERVGIQYNTFSEFLRFCVIGGLALFVDMGGVYLAHGLLNFEFLFSRGVGFIAAFTFTFICNRAITFKNKQDMHIVKQYILYAVVALIAFSVNCFISVYLYNKLIFFHRFYLVAASMGSIGGMFINFWGTKLFVFRSV